MMFIWFVLAIVLVIVLIDQRDYFTKKRTDQILDEQLAKGEVSVEEYRKIKKAKS